MCIRSHWKQKCSTLKIQPGLSSHWLISELSWLGSGMCRSALFWLRRNLGGRTWHKLRKHQKLRPGNSVRRLAWSGRISAKQRGFFKNLLITDECWLGLGWDMSPADFWLHGYLKVAFLSGSLSKLSFSGSDLPPYAANTCWAPSACWTCGGWPEQQQAGHGCPISAEDEGKGSGLHRCWWRSVWGKKSVNCNVYPSANVLQIVIRNE